MCLFKSLFIQLLNIAIMFSFTLLKSAVDFHIWLFLFKQRVPTYQLLSKGWNSNHHLKGHSSTRSSLISRIKLTERHRFKSNLYPLIFVSRAYHSPRILSVHTFSTQPIGSSKLKEPKTNCSQRSHSMLDAYFCLLDSAKLP